MAAVISARPIAFALCAWFCLLSVTACTSRRHAELAEAIDEGSSIEDSTRTGETSTSEDIGPILEEALGPQTAPVDPTDLPASPSATRAKSRPGRRVRWDISTFYGSRADTRATFHAGKRAKAGARSIDGIKLGYVRLAGLSLVKSVLVGNMKLQMGERLVLGRGLLSYAMSTSSHVRGGVTASPSLSRWFGRLGAAIDLGTSRWNAQAAVVSEDTQTVKPSMFWLSSGYHTGLTTLGASLGIPARSGAQWKRISVASVYTSHRGKSFESSVEIAVWPGREPYFATRVKRPGRYRWSIRYYRAPMFSTGALPMVGASPNRILQHGATAEGYARKGRVGYRLLLSMSSRQSPAARRRLRRAVFSANGVSNRINWALSLVWLDDRETSRGRGLETAMTTLSESEIRFRSKLTLSSGRTISHAVVLDYRPRARWSSDGTSIALTTRAVTGRIELHVQVAGYSLAPGQGVFISRPGVGNFDWFTTVYGKGSDVALRLKLRASERLSLFAYYGEPWLKEHRFYVGVRYMRR